MKSILSLLIVILGSLLTSCSSAPTATADREPSSQNCWDAVRGEYQSYFDKVEKCIEKQDQK